MTLPLRQCCLSGDLGGWDGIGLLLSMNVFQDANWVALMPYLDWMTEQVSPETTRCCLLQVGARPGMVFVGPAGVVEVVLVVEEVVDVLGVVVGGLAGVFPWPTSRP